MTDEIKKLPEVDRLVLSVITAFNYNTGCSKNTLLVQMTNFGFEEEQVNKALGNLLNSKLVVEVRKDTYQRRK